MVPIVLSPSVVFCSVFGVSGNQCCSVLMALQMDGGQMVGVLCN